jgi:gluconate:H+ symporter, GntP family
VSTASLLANTAGTAPQGTWPFVVLIICVALIVVMITVLKLHAFLALILAGVSAGLLSRVGSLEGEPKNSHWVQAVELTAKEFGNTAGEVGVVVGMAAIIGMCMFESGAAEKVVRRFLAVFGEQRAGIALLFASYVLSMPIFFDTFFMLLLPIAMALAIRTGKNYVMYSLVICSAGTMTHGLMVPHPGPIAMSKILGIEVGTAMIGGALIGLVPVSLSWFLIKRINAKMPIAVRATAGKSLEELSASMDRPESELPSFMAAIVPVLLPIILISLASTLDALASFKLENPGAYRFFEFIGNRNIALGVGALLSIAVVAKQRGWNLDTISNKIAPPLETAGVIIMITSAGGAFGLMLKNAGVGGAIQEAAAGYSLDLILLSWATASVIRVAQGSATVSLLTTAAMMQPIIAAGSLPYNPVYVFAAIGFGGMICPWMNDSGFWVVGRLAGFNEKETLKTWTTILTFNSVVGLITVLILSRVLPLG